MSAAIQDRIHVHRALVPSHEGHVLKGLTRAPLFVRSNNIERVAGMVTPWAQACPVEGSRAFKAS